MQKSYQYSPWGKRLSQVTFHPGGTSEDAYFGYNPHTDVETLTDETGNTKATYGYTAYGQNDTAEFTGVDAPDPANPGTEPYNVYRYNAKRFDTATGLYDMGFRNYDPGINRFLTRDMYNGALADLNLTTNPWTGNRYAFTGGNPITRIEIDGHLFCMCGSGTVHEPNFEPMHVLDVQNRWDPENPIEVWLEPNGTLVHMVSSGSGGDDGGLAGPERCESRAWACTYMPPWLGEVEERDGAIWVTHEVEYTQEEIALKVTTTALERQLDLAAQQASPVIPSRAGRLAVKLAPSSVSIGIELLAGVRNGEDAETIFRHGGYGVASAGAGAAAGAGVGVACAVLFPCGGAVATTVAVAGFGIGAGILTEYVLKKTFGD